MNTPNIKVDKEGNYGIRINSDVCGTQEYYGTEVTLDKLPSVSAGPDLVLNYGETISLQGSAPENLNILWTPSNYLDNPYSVNPLVVNGDINEDKIEYTITASNENCSTTDQMILSIISPLSYPNAFTPNGDGINDVWTIEGIEEFPDASIYIYNRWGVEIFKSKGYEKPWDGTFEGEICPNATYYYIIELNDPNNKNGSLSGSLTVIH